MVELAFNVIRAKVNQESSYTEQEFVQKIV